MINGVGVSDLTRNFTFNKDVVPPKIMIDGSK